MGTDGLVGHGRLIYKEINSMYLFGPNDIGIKMLGLCI